MAAPEVMELVGELEEALDALERTLLALSFETGQQSQSACLDEVFAEANHVLKKTIEIQ